MSRPEHVDRDPASAAQLAAITEASTTVDFSCKSQMQTLPRAPSNITLAQEFNTKKQEAIQVFNQVKQACEASGKPFFDKEFHFMGRDFLYPPGSPDDCTVGEPNQVGRAVEVIGSTKLFDGSSNYDVDAEDIQQGGVGDCFMIGSISSVANYMKQFTATQQKHPGLKPNFTAGGGDPIKRIFVAHDTQWSIYAVMMYGMGAWEWVIVDGLLACREDGGPKYANCGPNEKELWPVILEKAYFKHCATVDSCDGGFSAQATATITGGVKAAKIDLEKMKFKQFAKIAQDPLTVMDCSVRNDISGDGGEAGSAGEESGPKGLFKGHAYSVLAVKETSIGMSAVCVRNPWGNESEWTGDWSDSSPLWDQHPEVKKQLNHSAKADGTFWMSAKDFKKYMECDVVYFFPDTSQCLTMCGTFGADTEADDQYVLKVDKPGRVRVIVGQHDSRFAERVGGISEENHQIVKGKAEWSNMVAQNVGMRVFSHPKGAPKPETIQSSPHKTQLSAIQTWGATCLVDIEKCPAGFISICPIVTENGIPYYVRAIVPQGNNATLYRLSKGIAEAVGKTDIPEPEPEPDVEPGQEQPPFSEQEVRGFGEEPLEGVEDDDGFWEDAGNYDENSMFAQDDYYFGDDEEYGGGGGGGGGGGELIGGYQMEEIQSMFAQFDISGDGVLDKSEIMACAVHFWPDASPSEISSRITEADLDGDGNIDFDEFCNIIRDSVGGAQQNEAIYQQQIGGDEQPYEDEEEYV